MAKSNHITLKKRVEKVAELLLRGDSRTEILQYASKYWKVTDRQADSYIAKARGEIENSVTRKVEFNYAKAERRFEAILKKALKNGDLRTALTTTKELATLQGLYKTQVEQSGEIVFVSNIPD